MNPEDKVREALTKTLTNAMIYPPGISHRVLGTDMSNVIDRAVEAVLASGAVDLVDAPLYVREKINRVEVIEHSTRAYMNYEAEEVSTALQDGGRTLKVFLQRRSLRQ